MATNIEVISTIQLERKLHAIKYYEERIVDELKKRKQQNNSKSESIGGDSKRINVPKKKIVIKRDPKKKKTIKCSPKKKKGKKVTLNKKNCNNDENKSKKQIKASIIAMRNVLDNNNVKYKKSDNKTELSNLLRKNYLIRLAESEQIKLKKSK